MPLLCARSPQSQAILRARDDCARDGRLSAEQRRALDRLEYADKPWVQRYVHCFWTHLQLWEENGDGFNAARIVQTYGGPQRFNEEQALPAISACNARARRTSAAQRERCYKAFVCILRSPVGNWYRRYMMDVINGNA
ncbi:hypothetical protein KR044_001088 [Drosophila immigrans]|nr:hypothetical protein KR044_001088 [Drosophila immigrans]